MKLNQELNELIAIFSSGMIAVAVRLFKATEKPSVIFVIGELLIGLSFCFVLAPAVQEHFALSTKSICAITWAGCFFSGMVLKQLEALIKAYFQKLTPKNNE
jgi:hypothetical protein